MHCKKYAFLDIDLLVIAVLLASVVVVISGSSSRAENGALLEWRLTGALCLLPGFPATAYGPVAAAAVAAARGSGRGAHGGAGHMAYSQTAGADKRSVGILCGCSSPSSTFTAFTFSFCSSHFPARTTGAADLYAVSGHKKTTTIRQTLWDFAISVSGFGLEQGPMV